LHLATAEQLNQQKLEIDNVRLEVAKLDAKVKESDMRLITHGKWLEDHLNTFSLLQGREQKQGKNTSLNKEDGDDHVKMVVGILSAKRETPTVLKMVQKLVEDLNMNQFKVLLCSELIVSCVYC
jgi:hypothetical protein